MTWSVWNNDDRPELRMEAVFILTELGHCPFSREQLNRVVADPRFEGDELRQAAVWALGKSGLKCYEDVLPFIDDADENLALHAIGAFGADTPRPVIDRLVQDLIADDPRRAPAASEALRIIASDEVLRALVTVANARQPVPDWIVATLGRLPPVRVRAALQDSPLLDRIAPMLLTAQGAHWLASGTIGTDIAFLLKQNLSDAPKTCHRPVRFSRALGRYRKIPGARKKAYANARVQTVGSRDVARRWKARVMQAPVPDTRPSARTVPLARMTRLPHHPNHRRRQTSGVYSPG